MSFILWIVLVLSAFFEPVFILNMAVMLHRVMKQKRKLEAFLEGYDPELLRTLRVESLGSDLELYRVLYRYVGDWSEDTNRELFELKIKYQREWEKFTQSIWKVALFPFCIFLPTFVLFIFTRVF